MKKRLVNEFRVGEEVEMDFGDHLWQRAVVVQLAHPGLWVRDGAGRHWYVTNTKRIRRWLDAA